MSETTIHLDQFYERLDCRNKTHCRDCRGDRYWRMDRLQFDTPPDGLIDWACPLDVPWPVGYKPNADAAPAIKPRESRTVRSTPQAISPTPEQQARAAAHSRATAAFRAGCDTVGITLPCCGDSVGKRLIERLADGDYSPAAKPQTITDWTEACIAWVKSKVKDDDGHKHEDFFHAMEAAWQDERIVDANKTIHKPTLREMLHGAKEIMLTRLGIGVVADEVAEKRLAICQSCPHNKDETCGLCGCILSEKIWRAAEGCPDTPPQWLKET